MEALLKRPLAEAVYQLEQDGANPFPSAGGDASREAYRNRLVDESLKVAEHLEANPQDAAYRVSRALDLDRDRLMWCYKVIQRTPEVHQHWLKGVNRDYFNVVDQYFNHRFFVLVFFVGLSCPSRCQFCPNVKIDENGNRRLVSYDNLSASLVSQEQVEQVFRDLTVIRERGSDILVKVSGGLEPLSDVETLSWITREADKSGFPVKLFTNGLLLNTRERRRRALEVQDIRVSVSTADDEVYESIAFGIRKGKGKVRALARLRRILALLVEERNGLNPDCRIGFNSIVMPSNCGQLDDLVEMAVELGIDYIDFKPDYFSPHDPQVEAGVAGAIERITRRGEEGGLALHITGSLSGKNLFWRGWQGAFDAVRQSEHKIFITPFGHLSPVHYGAFPHSDENGETDLENYSIGRLGVHGSLLDVLEAPVRKPGIDLNRLNPFELILALESLREEKDEAWGIPTGFSPYHTTRAHGVSMDG